MWRPWVNVKNRQDPAEVFLRQSGQFVGIDDKVCVERRLFIVADILGPYMSTSRCFVPHFTLSIDTDAWNCQLRAPEKFMRKLATIMQRRSS